jgi:hypothetical protein
MPLYRSTGALSTTKHGVGGGPQSRIFESVSQELVSLCQGSLRAASTLVARSAVRCPQCLALDDGRLRGSHASVGTDVCVCVFAQSPLDGQLFQVRQLLLLRAQLGAFDAAFVQTARSVDLDRLRGPPGASLAGLVHLRADSQHSCRACIGAAGTLLQNSRRLLSLSSDNALYRFLQEGLPKSFVVAQRDSRKVGFTPPPYRTRAPACVPNDVERRVQDMDEELKRVCEQLIGETARTMTDAVAAFLARVRPNPHLGW